MEYNYFWLDIASVVVGFTLLLSHLIEKDRRKQGLYLGLIILSCIFANILNIHWRYIVAVGFDDNLKYLSVALLYLSMYPIIIGQFCVAKYLELQLVKKTALAELLFKIIKIGFAIVFFLLIYLSATGQIIDCSGDRLAFRPGLFAISLSVAILNIMQFAFGIVIFIGGRRRNAVPVVSFLGVTMLSALLYAGGYDYYSFPLVTLAILVFYLFIQKVRINMSDVEFVSETLAEAEETNVKLAESYYRYEADQQVLDTIASIYNTMHIIDFNNNELKELSANNRIHNILMDNANRSLQEQIWSVMMKVISERHRDKIFEFTNFSTLDERMKGKKTIYCDALSDNDTWWRFLYIRMGKVNESLDVVIFLTQNIDEEKRREEKLLLISNTDRLTGLANRNAYYSKTAKLERTGIPSNLWYLCLDINGLKTTNDNRGHGAGDELIVGAANCLRNTFGSSQQIYRMGGDEFVIMVEANESELDQLINDLNRNLDVWKGKFTEQLSIAIGVVCAAEFDNCTVTMLEKEADARMYKQKRAYYREHPLVDRRHS